MFLEIRLSSHPHILNSVYYTKDQLLLKVAPPFFVGYIFLLSCSFCVLEFGHGKELSFTLIPVCNFNFLGIKVNLLSMLSPWVTGQHRAVREINSEHKNNSTSSLTGSVQPKWWSQFNFILQKQVILEPTVT